MPKCTRCEKIPPKKTGDQSLYIKVPLQHSLKKLKQALSKEKIPFYILDEELLCIVMLSTNTNKIMKLIAKSLNDVELEDSLALLLPQGEKITITSLMNANSLKKITSQFREAWLLKILRDKSLLTYFQPIVNSNLQIHGYECLLRAINANNEIITPQVLFEAAKSADVLFFLDREARITAIKNARLNNINQKIFINFNPASIYDPKYCLNSTIEVAKQNNFTPEKIIFEVVESSYIRETKHLITILNFYRENGFGIALDDLGAGYNSLNLLSKLRPDYIKIDMNLIRNIDKLTHNQIVVNKIAEMADELKIHVLCEGVETQSEFEWLKNNGIEYFQGFLIGKPEPVADFTP